MNTNWFNAYDLERRAAKIFFDQEQYGWYFDKKGAINQVEYLESELQRLYSIIRPELTYELKVLYDRPLNKVWLKNGDYSNHLINYCNTANLDITTVGGPFHRIVFNEPNLSSDVELRKQLYRLGWEPIEWNYKKERDGSIKYDDNKDPIKTSPKLTEDSYDSLTVGIGPDLKKYLIYRHRQSQIKGLIRNVRDNSTIPSIVDSCGTPTARVRHKVVTNIPRPGSVWGNEMRTLFQARPGRVLVGEDRAQIEARLIAHVSILILGHTKLADVIMGRDFHQVIFEALEGLCSDRQAAKTPEYAFFFGAREKKLGQSIDNKPKEWSYKKAGTEVMKLMKKNIPGIIEVRDALGKAAERGYIKGFDGRRLFVRKPHAALNTYTQGNGSICCKTAMVLQQEEKEHKNLDTYQVGYFHDETQNDTDPSVAEEFSNITRDAIVNTGKLYKLKVPLDGEAKIGKNWAETH